MRKANWILLAVMLSTGLFFGCGDEDPEIVTYSYEASDEAFRNPMKGYKRVRYINEQNFTIGEYVSTVSHIIRYTDLESSAGDTVQKIIDWSNNRWNGLAPRNVKVIPRVVIVNNPGEEYWPAGLGSGSLA